MANKPANSLQNLLSRKRPAKAPPDLGWTLDELATAGGMHGIKEFVEQALSASPVRLAVTSEADVGSSSSGIPASGIPELNIPNSHIPKVGRPELIRAEAVVRKESPPELIPFPALVPSVGNLPHSLDISQPALPEVGILSSGILTSGIPEQHAAELDFGEPLEIRATRDYPIREVRLAQDAHSRGEQAVYATLWRLSEEGKRRVSIGLTTLARRAGMSRSTCQVNLANLETKLSIEIHVPRAKGGSRSYRVLSYEEILRRRRAAGLTHFQRVTSGVRLLMSEGREVSFGIPTSGIPGHNSGIPGSGMPTASSGIPNLGTQDIDKQVQEKTTTTITESEIAEVVAALRRMTGRSDDDAARTMLLRGREASPNLSAREVADMIEQEAPALFRNPRLDNPMGTLITRIPTCCQGETLRLFRAEQHKRNIAKARDIVQNWSDHTQAEQEWATAVLNKDENM